MLPISRVLVLCTALFVTAAFISLSVQRIPTPSGLPSFGQLREAVAAKYGESVESAVPAPNDTDTARPRYAFATFISGPAKEEKAASKLADIDQNSYQYSNSSVAYVDACAGDFVDEGEDDDADVDPANGYYLGVRTLLYALMHQPSTKSRDSTRHDKPEFIVLHTAAVPRSQLRRLQKDGATLIRTEPLAASWITQGMGSERWGAVLDKLRLWELDGTDGAPRYDKICFIDADHLVTGPLDGVFTDPATEDQQVRRFNGLGENPDARPVDGYDAPPQLPETFMFAGKYEAGHYGHDVPPPALAPLLSQSEYDDGPEQQDLDGFNTYLNSGFFVLRPDRRVFDFYAWLLAQPNVFEPGFPEQNLLNHAHRRNGPMPWVSLSWRWNMNWPTSRDYDAGARSFHAKYWDSDDTHDLKLKAMWQNTMREMRGYYRGREEAMKKYGGEKNDRCS